MTPPSPVTLPISNEPHERRREVVVLVAMMALSVIFYLALSDRFVLDCDVVNLALGIERFDPTQHQPHPPGYLGYVMVLRAVHAITRLSGVGVAILVSRLFALATILLSWVAARRQLPEGGRLRRRCGWRRWWRPIRSSSTTGSTDRRIRPRGRWPPLSWPRCPGRAAPSLLRTASVGLLLAAGDRCARPTR